MIHPPTSPASTPAKNVGLYIHFPWCHRKCPYCDFNSHQRPADLPEDDYVSALLWDLDQTLERIERPRIETIFMGGGTPSLFSPGSIERLLNGIQQRLDVDPKAEITLEANPGTVDNDRFSGYHAAGINRLSLGIQSFQDRHLNALGRIHSGREAIDAAVAAHKAGFREINLDLMFALPDQSLEDALSDIQCALEIGPSHLSYYHLTLEPNTYFYKYPPAIPDAENAYAIQEAGQSALARAGYTQYEVSAYALKGSECRHNSNYWQFGDYLGIGAGAHGKWTDPATHSIQRTTRIRHPVHYLEGFKSGQRRLETHTVQTDEVPFEFLMNALRLKKGFVVNHFESGTGQSIDTLEPHLSHLIAEGLLIREADQIRCTERGFNILDSVLQAFLP